jgi:hypothetical protein
VTLATARRGGGGQGHRDPWEARTRTDQSSSTEAAWNITRCCRAKGKSGDTSFASCNQRLACRISLSHTSGMHCGSMRVSTDAQKTALQRVALRQAGGTTIFTDAGLSGATVQRPALTRCLTALRPMRSPACAAPACLGGVTHGARVTHLRRGARARERVTQAVGGWSGVLCRDSDTHRTGDAAVAGPRSPVPLARRAHPLVPPVRRSRVPRRLS